MLQWKGNAISSAIIAIVLTASPAIADDVNTAKAYPAVVEVAMTNKPDGHQLMTLSQNPVHAGPVLFRVKNHSPNSVHEFLVLKTDLDPSALPMEDGGTRVDESKLSGIKELGDLEPGKSGQMQMTLSPGRYVLFCNQPGHFKAGMFATLTVTQ
jgi:uncharacterized cupredoxin-like copper-binding protein